MTQEIQGAKGSDWSKFLRKHWKAVALFAVAAILVFISAVYIFLWFTGNAQTTDLVPKTLDLWTMANAVSFMLHLIFWELIFVGIPTIIGAIAGWQWWRRIPQEEKKEYYFSDRRPRTRGAGGAISPLLFIAFAIKVYVDGNWNTPISTWTLEYVAGSMITILVWIVAIFAIPATIGVIWWIHHEMTKKA